MECEAKESMVVAVVMRRERKKGDCSFLFVSWLLFLQSFSGESGCGWLMTVLFQMYVGDYYKELIIKMI